MYLEGVGAMFAQGLTKIHRRNAILDSVDLHFSHGVFGLLGPSGAGKSTLLQILAGSLSPSHGDVILNQVNLSTHPDEYRQQIGYLPQHFTADGDWTILQLITTAAIFKGIIPQKNRSEKVKSAIGQVGLWGNRNRKIKTLPAGMLQRAGLAQAILNEPLLLLLDEPTTALNPAERAILNQLLCHYGKEHTVIFSSKNAANLLSSCRHVTILHSGRLLFNGSIKKIATMARENKVSRFRKMSNSSAIHDPDETPLLSDFVDGYRLMIGGDS